MHLYAFTHTCIWHMLFYSAVFCCADVLVVLDKICVLHPAAFCQGASNVYLLIVCIHMHTYTSGP